MSIDTVVAGSIGTPEPSYDKAQKIDDNNMVIVEQSRKKLKLNQILSEDHHAEREVDDGPNSTASRIEEGEVI